MPPVLTPTSFPGGGGGSGVTDGDKGHIAVSGSGSVWTIDSSGMAAINSDALFSGTSFPGSPVDRQVFFRTDRGIHYFYDLANTRWLSIEEFVTSFPITNAGLTGGETAASNSGRLTIPYRATYSILLTRFQVATAVLVTNNASNYWTIKLNRADVDDNDTQVGTTMDTSADTVGKWVDRFISPNAVLDASARLLKLRVDKVSSPGGLLVTGAVHYRLVG